MYFLFGAHSTSPNKKSVYQGFLKKQRKKWELRETAPKETGRRDYDTHRHENVDKENNYGVIVNLHPY